MKFLIVVGALVGVVGVVLHLLGWLGSTATMIAVVVGLALLVGGLIRPHTRPGDFNRSGWSGS